MAKVRGCSTGRMSCSQLGENGQIRLLERVLWWSWIDGSGLGTDEKRRRRKKSWTLLRSALSNAVTTPYLLQCCSALHPMFLHWPSFSESEEPLSLYLVR
jgi:hypothetical protein